MSETKFVDPVGAMLEELESAAASPERAEHIARSHGCVTNFMHGEQKLTIWKRSSGVFALEEYGCGGAVLATTYDPTFQSIAAEVHRLACEVGALRRRLVDRAAADHRAARAAEAARIEPEQAGEVEPEIFGWAFDYHPARARHASGAEVQIELGSLVFSAAVDDLPLIVVGRLTAMTAEEDRDARADERRLADGRALLGRLTEAIRENEDRTRADRSEWDGELP